jgi:hypothetical protein
MRGTPASRSSMRCRPRLGWNGVRSHHHSHLAGHARSSHLADGAACSRAVIVRAPWGPGGGGGLAGLATRSSSSCRSSAAHRTIGHALILATRCVLYGQAARPAPKGGVSAGPPAAGASRAGASWPARGRVGSYVAPSGMHWRPLLMDFSACRVLAWGVAGRPDSRQRRAGCEEPSVLGIVRGLSTSAGPIHYFRNLISVTGAGRLSRPLLAEALALVERATIRSRPERHLPWQTSGGGPTRTDHSRRSMFLHGLRPPEHLPHLGVRAPSATEASGSSAISSCSPTAPAASPAGLSGYAVGPFRAEGPRRGFFFPPPPPPVAGLLTAPWSPLAGGPRAGPPALGHTGLLPDSRADW